MKGRSRALTLLEVMVAIAILAMVSVLIYGAFDGMNRGRKFLGQRADRYHQGRAAMSRIAMELSSAFLSLHQPLTQQQIRRLTIFVGTDGIPADRLDFTSFSHRRLNRDSHESDQNEISYFGSPDPDVSGKIDLARREASMIDIEPKKGGEVHVLVDDIELFELRYLDPTTSLWTDTWDSTQVSGQPNRLPFEVKVTLVLKGGPNKESLKFVSKVVIPMQAALSFAVPR
jgi:general secretion pathway protein J